MYWFWRDITTVSVRIKPENFFLSFCRNVDDDDNDFVDVECRMSSLTEGKLCVVGKWNEMKMKKNEMQLTHSSKVICKICLFLCHSTLAQLFSSSLVICCLSRVKWRCKIKHNTKLGNHTINTKIDTIRKSNEYWMSQNLRKMNKK